MRRRLLLALLPAAPLALLLAGGCAGEPVNIGLVMLSPQGLLDRASGLDLAVFDAAKSECLATGHADVPDDGTAQRFALEKTGCTGGAAWCKTIQLDKDGSTKMFVVTAKNAAGVIAEGCGTAVINQDPLDVSIQVKRFNPPACCGDGQLQSGEQCEVAAAQGNPACSGIPADPVCGADCVAAELLLSIDNPTVPVLSNGAKGTKSDLALAFGPGAPTYSNALRALFVDRDTDKVKGASDIHERFLTRDLAPITKPGVLEAQLNLPLRCDDTTGPGIVKEQRSPDLAPVGDFMAVVYASDEVVGGIFDIFLSPQTADGCADTPKCADGSDCTSGVCASQGSARRRCSSTPRARPRRERAPHRRRPGRSRAGDVDARQQHLRSHLADQRHADARHRDPHRQQRRGRARRRLLRRVEGGLLERRLDLREQGQPGRQRHLARRRQHRQQRRPGPT